MTQTDEIIYSQEFETLLWSLYDLNDNIIMRMKPKASNKADFIIIFADTTHILKINKSKVSVILNRKKVHEIPISGYSRRIYHSAMTMMLKYGEYRHSNGNTQIYDIVKKV